MIVQESANVSSNRSRTELKVLDAKMHLGVRCTLRKLLYVSGHYAANCDDPGTQMLMKDNDVDLCEETLPPTHSPPPLLPPVTAATASADSQLRDTLVGIFVPLIVITMMILMIIIIILLLRLRASK